MRTNLTNQLLWIYTSLPSLKDDVSLLIYIYKNTSSIRKYTNPRISIIFYNKPIDYIIGNHYKYYIKKN